MCFMHISMSVFRSDSGVVNVYDMSSCLQNKYPQPLKAFPNLTTACSSLRFNSTDEVLAVASNMQEKAVKLVLSSITYQSFFVVCQQYVVQWYFSLKTFTTS